MRQLYIIFVHKITINETRGFIEQVIVRLDIKLITFLKFVIDLDFVFDDKRHVAERQRDVLSKDEPVVVFAVEPMTFVIT